MPILPSEVWSQSQEPWF